MNWQFPCSTLKMVSNFISIMRYVQTERVAGPGMHKLTSSITRSLCDQIFTSPIHWDTATGCPETATLVIDFGLGGMNGIGTLTAHNLEGHSVHVIILGDKGHGEVELFDVNDVQYEDWWNKKYASTVGVWHTS